MKHVAYTCDTFQSACPGCGVGLHFMRRGPVVLMPQRGHAEGCPALSWQQDVMRTQAVLGNINRGMTPRELARMLRGA